jgi:tellurite resistance protein TerC
VPPRRAPLSEHELFLWIAFAGLILACLAADLRFGREREGRMSIRAAAAWSIVWISLAAVFAGLIGVFRSREDALLFVTGYLVEKALSVDNMFVFIMIFSYFAVPEGDRPRVLKWGIFGAVIFRGALILAGRAFVLRAGWALYVFAALLLWAAGKMLRHEEEEEARPEKNLVLRAFRRFLPVSERYHGHRFFVREGGRLVGTALFAVLVVTESTDVFFALDSIPAIFGITQDLFIIFTSNIFAILGLRALFFVLAGVMDMFRFLKVGVAAILVFIAAKMLLKEVVDVPIGASLGVIGGVLAASVAASLVRRGAPEPEEAQRR